MQTLIKQKEDHLFLLTHLEADLPVQLASHLLAHSLFPAFLLWHQFPIREPSGSQEKTASAFAEVLCP